jgi:cysteinyl-tRNA synthetase
MDLRLTNTLTKAKEAFVPQDPFRVTMYVCGPTVYSYAHIGNARPPVVFDVLFRLLRRTYGEAHVLYAQNITDVDDKIIKASADTGKPIAEITALYERIYRDDMAALGVTPPTHRPHATEHVGGMIEIIEKLVEQGHAYRSASGVLFNVPSMANYGRLSGRDRDEMIAGARVEVADDKRDPADFALWKAAKPDEPPEARWPSPFGEGRPGWHIECSAMAKAVLGETIDIHAGGLDLIFPHHENEIAQSECAHGKPMARYWLHNGFLSMDSEKMSKSLGNVKLINELLKSWDGETLRLALLSAHYRQPLDWTDSLLQQSKATLDRIYNALRRLKPAAEDHVSDATRLAAATALKPLLEALHDDLNTPQALAELAGLATEANKAEEPDWARHLLILSSAGAMLGLLQKNPDEWARGEAGDAARIDALVAARIEARKAKNFAEADRIRKELAAEGVEIMDSAAGSTWRKV